MFVLYDNFTQQPQVINGCSDLLVEYFGDKGKHARSAVGAGSAMVDKVAVSNKDWDILTRTAQKFVAAVKEARAEM